MPADLGTTNLWLSVMAIASIAQLLLLIIGGVAAYRLYQQTIRQVEAFQHQELAPVMRRLTVVLEDASDVLGRVKTADDGVRHALDRTSATVQRAARVAGSRFWPVVGVIRGVRAAIGHLAGDRQSRLGAGTSAADVQMRSGRL
jgi:hypothetical protein